MTAMTGTFAVYSSETCYTHKLTGREKRRVGTGEHTLSPDFASISRCDSWQMSSTSHSSLSERCWEVNSLHKSRVQECFVFWKRLYIVTCLIAQARAKAVALEKSLHYLHWLVTKQLWEVQSSFLHILGNFIILEALQQSLLVLQPFRSRLSWQGQYNPNYTLTGTFSLFQDTFISYDTSTWIRLWLRTLWKSFPIVDV